MASYSLDLKHLPKFHVVKAVPRAVQFGVDRVLRRWDLVEGLQVIVGISLKGAVRHQPPLLTLFGFLIMR
jgi:hypothetical protein